MYILEIAAPGLEPTGVKRLGTLLDIKRLGVQREMMLAEERSE